MSTMRLNHNVLKVKPLPVIALTPTTRVRHFRLGTDRVWIPRVAIWRAFKLIATLVALVLVTGCGAPDLGDPVYLTGVACTSDADTAEALSEAAARWHEAAPRASVRVSLGGEDGCAIKVRRAAVEVAPTHAHSKVFAYSEPGEMTVDPAVPADVLVNLVTHELGHFLIGHAYDGADDEHSQDFASIMYWAVGPEGSPAAITALDAELVAR